MAVEFDFAVRSDIGLLRKNNQDSAYGGSRMLVVADGMGGPAGGDIASSIVVAHLAPLDDAPGAAESLVTDLTEALQGARDELIERSLNDRSLRGLGSTCTALLRSENKLAMIHIGDSRAYLLRDGVLTQITSDHSLVQYLVDTGQITKEEAETHPKRNVVVKVLTDSPGPVLADTAVREAVVGDRWLLCSDGLSGVVSDETIEVVMAQKTNLNECADELVNLALRGGGPDNISVVLADVVTVGTVKPVAPKVAGAAAVDRNAPSVGTQGAAGRAAALVNGNSDATHHDSDFDTENQPGRVRRLITWGIGLLAVFALVGSGLFFGWSWSQDQYYALGVDGRVVVSQGIPQTLGPWQLSRPVEVTDLRLEDLSEVDRTRLQDPVMRSSRDQIDTYLDEIRSRIQKNSQPDDEDAAQSGDLTQSGED